VLSGRGLCDVLNPCTEEFYGCLSVLCHVCCHVEICSTGRSLVQRSHIDVCLFDCCVMSGRFLCDELITCTE